MEIVGRISKGSKMDQIYIPKNRVGFSSGEYVIISSIIGKKEQEKKPSLCFYGVKNLEPIKIRIIEEIISLIEKKIMPENIIITGSFLDNGFGFNDIDILLINEDKINTELITKEIQNDGIKPHILVLNMKTLSSGLSSEPIYNLMLSKYVSKKRLIFNTKRKINYRILDLGLLKSKTLIDNFDSLNGNEKYYFVLNMISILLFIQGKKLSKDMANKEIENLFNVKIKEIKENLVKQDFLKKYKEVFNKTFNLVLDNIKHDKG